MKLVLLLTTILCVIANSTSINITCNSKTYDYQYSPVSCCNINSDFVITSEYEEIYIKNNNSDFKGFLADQKSIAYLPIGIEKCCDKIEVLMIKESGLKEITQKNMRNFPGVAVLDLSFNKIEILEADLFEQNPNIQFIYLNNNKIAALAPTVFDKLTKIKKLSGYLYMNENDCMAISDPITNIQQYKDELKDSDCFKYQKLVMIRKSVKTEKIKADLKHLFGSDAKQGIMLDFNDRMIAFENEIANLLSSGEAIKNISALIDESINKTFVNFVQNINEKVNESVLTQINDLNAEINRIKRDIEAMNNTNSNKLTQIIIMISKVQSQTETQINSLNLIKISTDKVTAVLRNVENHLVNISANIKLLQNKQHEASTKQSEQNTKIDTIMKDVNSVKNLPKDLKHFKNQFNETIKIFHENIAILANKINEDSQNSTKLITKIIGYINTVLLIIVITVLMYLIFRNQSNSKIISKPSTISSIQLNPQESVITSTITIPAENHSSVEPRNHNYDPYIENQIYDSVTNDEIQNDANQLSVLNPNDESTYECCGFNNDIYGTACDDDLYSEVISPNRAQSKKNTDDDDNIYAVVYKTQRD